MNLTVNEDVFINQTLGQYSIFRGCSDKELKKLFANRKFLLFANNDIIIKEGEEPKGIYLILSGLLKISRKVDENKKFILKLASKGDIIGIDCSVSGINCLYSVQVIEKTDAIFIPKSKFLKMIRNNIIFWREIMNFIAKEVEFARIRIISFSHKNTKQRLAETIIFLNKNIESRNSGSDNIHLKPTDLASLIGTTIGNLYKLLAAFNNSGLISYERNKMKILDHNALLATSNSEVEEEV